MVVYLWHESKNYAKRRESYLNFILYNVKQLIDSNKFYTERKSIACVCVRVRACVIIQNRLTRSTLYTFDK